MIRSRWILLALAFVAAAAAPVSVLAQASISHATSSPQGGVSPFSSSDTSYKTSYWSQLDADYSATIYAATGQVQHLPALNSNGRSSWDLYDKASPVPGTSNVGSKNTNTTRQNTIDALNRLCRLMDTTSQATAATDGTYSAPSDNRVIVYDGVRWYDLSASDSAPACGTGDSCNHSLGSIVCTSYQLPLQTLAASSYNTAPHTSVQLNWADTAPRDQIWYLDAHNLYVTTGPVTTYSTSNFTIPASGQSNPVCYAGEFVQSGNGCPPAALSSKTQVAAVAGAIAQTSCTQTWQCTEPGLLPVPNYGPGSTSTPPLTTTTTYTYTATNPNGSTIDTVKVNVSNPPPLLGGATCSASPTSANTGATATWSASGATGGTAPYTYTWAGDAPLAGKTGISAAVQYTTAGTKSGSVTVTDSGSPAQQYTASCSNTVAVSAVPLAATCSVPQNALTNTAVAWTATASGGSGTYSSYVWTGTGVASPPKTTTTNTYTNPGYSTAGTYAASVTATDSSGATSPAATCYSTGNPTNPYITIMSTAQPDLVTGAVSPASALAGVSQTYSAAVTNQGTGTTGSGFTNLLQQAVSSSGAGTADVTNASMFTLAAGATSNASFSYSTSTVGTVYLRVCADKSSADNAGTIAESVESNNCGGWTPIAVAATLPLPACSSFTASPSLIALGNSVTVAWSCQNATSCTAVSNGDGFTTGNAYQNNGKSVTPSMAGLSQRYAINCSGSGGSAGPFYSSAFTVVPPNAKITATPNRVTLDSNGVATTNLSWSAQTVTACSVYDNRGHSIEATTSADVNDNFSGLTAQTITAQTMFTIFCDTAGNHSTSHISASTVVNINLKEIEF